MLWLVIVFLVIIAVYGFAAINMRMACKNLYG